MAPASVLSPPRIGASEPASDAGSVYTTAFWLAYAANVSVVAANSLTFRFAELVDFLGGKEQTAGLIVGVATLAALLSRLVLGQALDRYGVRRLWLGATLLFLTGGVLLTFAHRLDWTLYLARAVFAVGVAGMVTCSTVHIQNLVPPHRRTEVLGSLGSSGFVGMIVGSVLGDVIFAHFDGRTRYALLFGAATFTGLWYLALVVMLTRGERHAPPAETPALHRLVVRYWPGNVMLVALAMGTMLAVTTVFLTRFATHRGLSGLGPFFAAYSASAFTFRMVARQWSRTVGRHRMILFGLTGHSAAMFLLPTVRAEWQFLFPALLGGFGHALLFPAVVSLGSEPFPLAYRGTATTLVLGFFDVGMFLSAPLLGWVIDLCDADFTPMFLGAGAVTAGVAVLYQLTGARRPDADFMGRERVRAERKAGRPSARGDIVPRSLTAELFASQETTTAMSCGESDAAGLFGPQATVVEPFGNEDSTPRISASQEIGDETFARGGSEREPSAPDWTASGKSARGGSASREGRANVTAATRCR